VLDLLPGEARGERLFPVGRLDLDSEGLLLLTNDGDVAQAMLHPSFGCEKEYRVTVRGRLSPAARNRLAAGVELEDGPMAPCEVGAVRADSPIGASTFHITLREGRKRQIRRALAALGHPVLRLVRIRMGPLRLGRLQPRRARPLAAAERRALPRASLRGSGQGSG
jgi:pseudouridine synthase